MSSELSLIRKQNLRRVIDDFFDGVDSQFAAILGKTPGQLSRIFSTNSKTKRNIGNKLAREIEVKAGLPENWLDESHKKDLYNPRPAKHFREVPVTTLESIAKYTDPQFIQIETKTDIAYIVGEFSENTFALNLFNHGMGEGFPKDAKICFDPTILPYHKALIIVQIQANEKPIFRQLLLEGERRYLKAFDPDYPTVLLTKHATILGVFVGADYSDCLPHNKIL